MKVDDEKLFELAIKLRDSKKYNESISKLKEFISKYPNHPKIAGVYFVLSGVYSLGIKDQKKGMYYAKKAKKIKPEYEPASLSIYLTYIRLEEYDKAIKEVISYLKKHKANLYKDTLKELLSDLKDGYMIKYKDQIIELAKNNNISIPRALK